MLARTNSKKTLRDTCHKGNGSRRGRRLAAVLAAAVGLWACARTGLDPWDLDPSAEGFETGGTAGATTAPTSDASAGMPQMPERDSGIDSGPDSSIEPDASVDPTVPDPDPTECEPAPETCNGRDDDCDGQVDDLPGEPCAGGGFRYCVAGRLSDCPRSCEACVPGSIRICQNSYCTFWGEQECAADGQGFGPCREGFPPPRCERTAFREHASPELEQCCIDDGYCCLDVHDLDHDGDRRDMVGACDGVRCP